MTIVRLGSAYNLNSNNITTMSPTKIAKKSDKPLLGQILKLIPDSLLQQSIATQESDKHCHKYKTCDQLVAMMPGS